MKRAGASKRKAGAARRNGKLGGRPRDKLPATSLAKLGDAPTDPIALGDWLFRVNAEVTALVMRGEIGSELAEHIRASVNATLRAMPASKLQELADALRAEADQLDGAELGAQTQRRNDAARTPALRRDAR